MGRQEQVQQAIRTTEAFNGVPLVPMTLVKFKKCISQEIKHIYLKHVCIIELAN